MLNSSLLQPLIPAVALMMGLGIAHAGTWSGLVSQWLSNDDFSYGLLIVPIALYLAWSRRERLRGVPIRPDWRALVPMVAALGLGVVGEIGAELFTVRFAMIVFLIAAVWLFYGTQVFRILCFPLLFLFLMLPLPGMVYRNITFPLQLISSQMSVEILHLFGVTAFREGNVIDLGFAQFQVVEACNGLRYILPLFTLGVLFAFMGRKALWKRLVLVAATVPFAMLANILRIAGTGLVSLYWGVKAAEGFFHSFSGLVVFLLCLGLFAALHFLLTLLPGEPAPEATGQARPSATPPSGGPALPWAPMVVALVLIAMGPAMAGYLGQVAPRALKKPLTEFPVQVDGYQGKASAMDPLIWDRVGGQSYVIIDYQMPGRPPIDFYAAYYEHQRKAGDFIHSPKLCLPGAGWFIEHTVTRQVPLAQPVNTLGTQLVFNEMVIQKEGQRQLVYYWYQGRERNFTSEYLAKFYMVWDGIWRRRTAGALVRLVMPLTGMDATQGRQVLDRFALFVGSRLTDHLP